MHAKGASQRFQSPANRKTKKGPRLEIREIGPAEARELLKLNTGNYRPINESYGRKLAKDMVEGKWDLTGDTIKITDNLVIDGQHRLWAIIHSGVAIKTAVAWDVAADAKAIDWTKPRNVSLYLKNLGFKHYNNVASIARFAILHDIGKWNKPQLDTYEGTQNAIIEYCIKHQESLHESANLSGKVKKIIPPSMIGAVIHIGSGRSKTPEDSEVLMWFLSGIQTGANLDENDPPFALRTRLLAEKQSQVKSTRFYQRMLLTMAWNRAVRGEQMTLRHLRIRATGPTKQTPPNEVLVVDDL